MPLLFTAFLLVVTLQNLSAQQQSSAFSVPGWAPGYAPVFTGSNSNIVSLSYGDSLTTTVGFSGFPNDGLGTDVDNIASMSFSYTYTVYLTPIGDTFSASSSILIGTHTISASQTCSSGTVPPWSIGYDAQPALDTNSINFNIADGITDCIPQGSYQVDVVINTYAQNSVGPNAQAIQLEWLGYTNSGSGRVLATLTAPSTSNTDQVAVSPATNYLLSQIAFVQVSQPQTCPPLTLSLPASILTHASLSSATVSASYAGACRQNPCTYLWNDGQRTATAVNLSPGSYTVTVTSPCGLASSASVTISQISSFDPYDVQLLTSEERFQDPYIKTDVNKVATERGSHSHTSDASHENENTEPSLNLYPNPATHNITLDFVTGSTTTYSVRILDIQGNEIIKPATNVSVESGNQKIHINLDQLKAGVYLYEITADKTYRGKFVKQ